MSAVLSTTPTRELRRARAAVAVCFALNAIFYANLVPRLPALRDDLGLSNSALGLALAGVPLGALILGPAAAVLVRRYSSGLVASYGSVVLAIGVAAVAVAPNWPALAAVLLVVGGMDAIVDVAQNAHGLRVQRGYGRSILNALHGLWSLGAVAGGLLGSAAAGLDIPLGRHLGAMAVVFGLVALLTARWMLPGRDDEAITEPAADQPTGGGRSARRSAVIALAVLGTLAASAAFVEDSASSWSAIWLRDDLAATAAVAGLGFVAFQVAMTLGRLTGDRVVDRFGQRRVARIGGAVAAAGFGLMLAVPTVPTTLLGYALAGVGVATLVPAVYAAADGLPGLRPGVGLTAVNWLLRIGFLVSPPLVGLFADLAELRTGLLVVVLAGLLVLTLGRTLRTTVAPTS
ncbi:Fucose permease [Blastococcus aurantiacus]|uniref:Fucose permease n=1 Tax=Blastococcus aurantiacus TaxID=1550231 RepID=A0A1G7MXC9_9ACTN|nr:MFS transporter [Blastococcus aurantiacus]SDF66337.1 Fucose permease [Blastococcus aurantiacus]